MIGSVFLVAPVIAPGKEAREVYLPDGDWYDYYTGEKYSGGRYILADAPLDKVPVWMDKNGRTMLVTYMAVRDKSGKYLGTMELVQDMEFAKEYFQK